MKLISRSETISSIDFELPIDEDNLPLIKQEINPKKTIVFLIHGFLSDSEEKWMHQLSSAYLKRVNIILLS